MLKLLNTLILSTLLIGCLSPRQEDSTKDKIDTETDRMKNATFFIDKIGAEVTPGRTNNRWGLLESAQYSFEACLKDRKQRKDILGHTFSVNDGKLNYRAVSDENGCIHWTEEIFLNPLAQPRYIYTERVISSTGVHKGIQAAPIAISPWGIIKYAGAQTDPFVDLTRFTPPQDQTVSNNEKEKSLSGRDERGNLVEVPIWTKRISLKIDDSVALGNGSELTMTLKFNPYLTLKDVTNQDITKAQTRGLLKAYVDIYAIVLEKGVPTKYLITSYAPDNYTEFMGGEFTHIFSTTIHQITYSGKLEAALRIVPHPSLKGVKSFDGIFALNEPTKIIGNHSGVMIAGQNNLETKSFTLEESYKNNVQKARFQEGSELHRLDPFEMGTMDVRFDSIEKGTETATKRTILYRIKSCITKTLNGEKVRYQRFRITLENGTVINRETDPQGCLLWNDKITHKYYKPEQLTPKKFHIEHINSGSKYTKIAYLNPWDFGWTFGRDKTELTDDYLEEMRKAPLVPSKLFLDRFQYQTLRFKYEVDQYLNLRVKKAVLLTADPKVLRYSSIVKGRRSTEWLRDGIYLLKVAVQKDYQDMTQTGVDVGPDPRNPWRLSITNKPTSKDIEYLTIVKKLVRVQFGKIITPLEFSMQDLRLMRIRSNLLLQIETIDEDALGISSDMKLEDIAADKVQKALQNYALNKLADTKNSLDLKDPEYANKLAETEKAYQELFENLDLDNLIEKDSGLQSRTFIGPITLIANSFSSGLRPTDDLTEVLCAQIDCNAINPDGSNVRLDGPVFNETDQAAEAEGQARLAKFYGDVGHFKDVTVTDLIKRLPEIAKRKENEDRFRSLLSSYLHEYRLDYISLSNKPLKVIKNYNQDTGEGYCSSKNIEDCIVETREFNTSPDTILNYLNFDRKYWEEVWKESRTNNTSVSEIKLMIYSDVVNHDNIDTNSLKEFISTGEVTYDMVPRLCYLWAFYMLDARTDAVATAYERKTLKHFFSGDPETQRDSAYIKCITEGEDRIANVFEINRHFRSYNTNTFYFEGGKSLNINIGASSSMSHGESTNRSVSFGAEPLKYLKHIPGAIFAGISKILDGIKWSMGTGWSSSEGYSDGTSVTAQTYLAMQQVRIDLDFDEMERCMSIKINPAFVEKELKMPKKMYAPLEFIHNADIITKGLFLCTGDIERGTHPYPEHYYYFTQHFTMGDMQDKGDIKNHPWLLALRGEYDYLKFVDMLDARPTLSSHDDFGFVDLAQYPTTGWWVKEPERLQKAKQDFELGELPLDQLIHVYNNVIPSFPGLYTARPKKLDYPRGTNSN